MNPNLPRRDLLTGSALAAGLALLNDAVGADNPAANVADRTATTKISALKPFRVGTKAYMKVETNHGIFGWGEVTGLDPNVACVLANSLFELLNGENPTRIEYLWQKIYRAHRNIRGGSFLTHVLSAIDCALWDITGKLWGVPVYRLLGGPVRDRIRVYHTAKALKVPPHGIYEHSGTPADIQRMVKAIADARERVGQDGVVMFDAHCAVPPATLIQLAAALKPYDLLFIEEPAVPGNIEVFKRLKQAINIPLAAGERDRTIWGFIPYLQERCLDILQPDCCHTGGISQMRKIAALAETYMTPLAPHCTASNLGISASIHAIAATALFLIHEFYPTNFGFNPKGVATMDWQVDKEGYVALPEGVGLGVEMDEKVLDEAAKKPQSYKWPGAKLKDGSIADY
jgi:galactonate dehydratase